MKMYKGFDKDLKCHDFQYEIGKTYEEPTAELCEKGFHACEYPLDVFGYYAPGDMSRYCEVDLDDVSHKKSNEDSKRCGKKIAVKAEIGIAGLVKAAVDFVMENIKDENKEANTGNYSASTNTGDYSASTNTGDCSASTNTGNYSASTNTGDCSASTNTGFCSASTNTGNYSASTNTGNYSASTNTGDRSASTNTGNYSKADVSGKESVAAALGIESKAKGVLGCWLVLAEWAKDENYNWHRKDVQCFKVDGVTVKPDTWYKLKNGDLVEVSE
ncbi:DUF7666 domain-containing protein [Gemmiger formicilis]|uniref:DUF7666 domain-containing protein n=1 Tax=Gemmiger formicilis TaxID=745368 RepID=UPI003CCB13E4